MSKRTLARETLEKVGEEVTLKGWVDTRRDHGGVAFLDLRDRSGVVQVVCSPEQIGKLRDEYVVEVLGTVKERPAAMVNEDLGTGTVEVKAEEITVLSESKTPPFDIHGDGLKINEKKRLEYRYLDLRRPRLAKNIRMRSKMVQFIRDYLMGKGFVEIETPILSKSTPEGARDFLVPSRLQRGKFYALPQSPQQYKQLLMVAGFERYFQIARCFRDEDPRADRAYGEFTQLDLEMSFVTQEDILEITEDLFTKMVEELWPEKRIKEKPWPRISHAEALEYFGADKFDLRNYRREGEGWVPADSPTRRVREKKPDGFSSAEVNPDELAFAWVVDFPLFAEQDEEDYFHGAGEKLAPSHHMFTAPHPDDVKLLDSDPMKVRGLQHDLVLNGFEVGGGSIRIHEADIQERVFELIGFGEEKKREFEHMLRAFQYGVPPHGGIAPGIDRMLMVILGEPSLREVMAFPTSGSGETAVMDAPSEVSEEQLEELGIEIVEDD